MATERTSTAETTTSTSTTADHNALKAGDKVEYDGKLAKVVNYGFLELPSNPGQDTHYSEKLVAHLQLPALTPGGKPEYAYYVNPDEITLLKDEPERRLELEKEFNALFGDPVPVDPKEDTRPAPEIRQKGPAPKAERTSSTRGVENEGSRANREPIDLGRATEAGNEEDTAAKTVDTSKFGRSTKSTAKGRKASK